jgi:hypothetical protein
MFGSSLAVILITFQAFVYKKVRTAKVVLVDYHTNLKTESEKKTERCRMNKKAFVMVLFLFFSIAILPVVAQTAKTIVAKYGSTPTIDGFVGDSEWSDASSISFNGTQVFVKQDGANLYVGFKAPVRSQSAMFIYFDINNDNSSTLNSDDICIGMIYNGTLSEFHKASNSVLWELTSASGWTASFQTTTTTCEAEFRIGYAKLSLTAGIEKTLGINFNYVSFATSENYFWSFNPDVQNTSITPSTWGSINSSGYNWIPEFPSLLILAFFVVAASLITIASKKRTLLCN